MGSTGGAIWTPLGTGYGSGTHFAASFFTQAATPSFWRDTTGTPHELLAAQSATRIHLTLEPSSRMGNQQESEFRLGDSPILSTTGEGFGIPRTAGGPSERGEEADRRRKNGDTSGIPNWNPLVDSLNQIAQLQGRESRTSITCAAFTFSTARNGCREVCLTVGTHMA